MSSSTEPLPGTYILGAIFRMPNEGGSVPAIAVDKRTGENLISLYSVLITLIFIPAWKLVALIAGRFLHHDVEEVRRPGSSWTTGFRQLLAAFAMTWEEIKAKEPDTSPKSWYHQLTLFALAFIFFLGSLLAGIFIPPLLVIGTVAPVQPSAVFFPRAPQTATDSEGWKVQALKAPAAARAVGSVGAAQSQGGGVEMVLNTLGSDTVVGYKYQVTGLDFGLQRQSQLVQTVEGRCITEHGWVDQGTDGDPDNEYYRLWDLPTLVVPVSKNQTLDPPWATFHLHPNAANMAETTGNTSFAIVVHSVGRLSYTPSSDPWYIAHQPTDPKTEAQLHNLGGGYQVLPGRPALSCWQKDTWSFGDQMVGSVFRLGELDGLNLPTDSDNFLRLQFAAPRIFDVGVSLGRSSLVSATTFLDRITITSFDAASSTLYSDLERLVWAAYVSSRDVFRESTMVVERYNIPNAVSSVGGDAAFAQFVLTTSAVSTLSLTVLIVLPVVCVSLWILHFTVAHLSARWWNADPKVES